MKVKKLKFNIIISFILVIIFNSCLPTYYPGIWGSRVPPIITQPKYKIKKKAKIIGFDAGNISTFYEDESNYLLRAHYLFLNSSKYANSNIGFLSYIGTYKVNEVEKYKGGKYYFGIGPVGNFNLQFPIGQTTFGLGLYYGMGIELGDFYTFRKNSDAEGLADNSTNPYYILLALYPYIGHQISDNKSIGLQFGIGLPGVASPSILYQSNNYFFWLSWVPPNYNHFAIYKYGSFTIGVGIIR